MDVRRQVSRLSCLITLSETAELGEAYRRVDKLNSMDNLPEHPRCPHCGSYDTERHWGDQLMQFGAGLIGGFAKGYLGIAIGDDDIEKGANSVVNEISQKYTCNSCNHNFIYGQPVLKNSLPTNVGNDDVVVVIQKYAAKYGKKCRKDFSKGEIDKLAKKVNLSPADLTSRLNRILSMPSVVGEDSNKPTTKKRATTTQYTQFQNEVSCLIEDYGSLSEIPESLIYGLADSLGIPRTKCLELAQTSSKMENLENKPSVQTDIEVVKKDNDSNIEKNEKEYMDAYSSCIEDGEVSDRERKLLDRLASTLNINSERMKQLEKSCLQPTFTEAEQQYLDEFKACLDDESNLSPSTRRLLDRLATSLGINETQKSQIEKIALK